MALILSKTSLDLIPSIFSFESAFEKAERENKKKSRTLHTCKITVKPDKLEFLVLLLIRDKMELQI